MSIAIAFVWIAKVKYLQPGVSNTMGSEETSRRARGLENGCGNRDVGARIQPSGRFKRTPKFSTVRRAVESSADPIVESTISKATTKPAAAPKPIPTNMRLRRPIARLPVYGQAFRHGAGLLLQVLALRVWAVAQNRDP